MKVLIIESKPRWSLTRALTILGLNFISMAYRNCKDLPHVLSVLIIERVSFEKDPVLPIEKFPSLVPPDRVATPYSIYALFFKWSLIGGKKQKKISNFGSNSGRDCLRKMVAYKRFLIQRFDLETFGIVENWSLRKGSRLREVVATGDLTVQVFL